MKKLIGEKPWILIVLGFLLLISVWTFFFVVALHNQPERLPLSLGEESPPTASSPDTGSPWI